MARSKLRAHAISIASITLAIGLALPANAQDALGSGRALDNNLRQGSNRANPLGRNYQSELEYRNAIVTGNVAGGASFRGNIGYTAPSDFRGALGSNEIYDFERDSLLSGLAGEGLRGADAIQFQRSFITGGLIDNNTGVPIIRRPGAGITYSDIQASPSQPISSFDPFSLRPGSLRSTSEFMVSGKLSPRILGRSETEQGDPLYALASPLRGVVMQSTPDYPSTMNYGFEPPESERWLGSPTEGDAARLRGAEADSEDEQTSRRSPLDAGNQISNRTTDRLEAESATDRVEPMRVRSEDVLAQLRSAFETPEDAEQPDARQDQPGDQPYSDPLTDPLTDPTTQPDLPETDQPAEDNSQSEDDVSDKGPVSPFGEDPARGPDAAPDDLTSFGFDEQLRELRDRLMSPPSGPADAEDTDEEKRRNRTEELARALLTKIEPRIEGLAPPGDTESVVSEMMREGERLLANERWFDAEERFAGALRLVPDDPFAAAGRLHAQIGAGLFRSAARNIERLFRSRPEMVPVRFEDGLLPTEQRLEIVHRLLRENMKRDNEFGRDCALIYAYLGRQTGDTEQIRDGFTAIDRIVEETGAPHDPLIDVLRTVWLNKENAPATK